LTLSGLDIWKSYPFKVSGIRQCFWKKKKPQRTKIEVMYSQESFKLHKLWWDSFIVNFFL
jgi:hypothetical protein